MQCNKLVSKFSRLEEKHQESINKHGTGNISSFLKNVLHDPVVRTPLFLLSFLK